MPKAKVIRPDIARWRPNVDKYFVYIESPTPENLEQIILAYFQRRFEKSYFQSFVKPFVSHMLEELLRSYVQMSPEMLEDVLPDLEYIHIELLEACVRLCRRYPWKLDDENPIDS
jgi:hypothetical protein